LKDPDLLKELTQVFANNDERVQKAALQAIIENRPAGSASALAELVPRLAPALLEDVFLELIFQADPECLPSLEKCFSAPLPPAVLWRLVSVIAALHTQAAEQLLVKIARNESLPQNVRAAASKAIAQRSGVKVIDPKNNANKEPGVITQGLGYAGA
jgi:HEAT repeat protein